MFQAQHHDATTVNQTHFCSAPLPKSDDPSDQTRLAGHRTALLNSSMWDRNTEITCRFLEGNAALRRRVQKAALEWNRWCNLRLRFIDGAGAMVRIGFQLGQGSWSQVGRDCLQTKDQSQPTMNFGWLDAGSDEPTLRSVVLHEFGHALGLIHEHQNPTGGIEWNRAAVVRDLKGPPNWWNEATIEHNMFERFEQVISTPVDEKSIMMYPVPAAWTTNGFSSGFNSELSNQDKSFMLKNYPK